MTIGPEHHLKQRLGKIAATSAAVTVIGVILSYAYGVGAEPGGSPNDVFTLGTAVAPPLFLTVLMLIGATLAARAGTAGLVGTGLAGIVGLAFLLGSTLNLPNDLDAARAADTPVGLAITTGTLHALFGLALLVTAGMIFRWRRQHAALSA